MIETAKIPIQRLGEPWPANYDFQTFLVRLDKLHPHYGGNKWFKLKHNLLRAKGTGFKKIITFGGAFSNHLRASAAAAKDFDLNLVCVVRGAKPEPLNPVLKFIERLGGTLHFVTRDQYRRKDEPEFLIHLQNQFGESYVIPEGGANIFGVLGCSEIPGLIEEDFDVIACACGTFTTLAGLSLGLNQHQHALGISILKASGYGEMQTNDLVEQTIRAYPHLQRGDWSVCDDYHFGGYAKSNAALENFRAQVFGEHAVETDFVYTAKLLFGIHDMILNDRFKPGSRIAVLMSGADNAAL